MKPILVLITILIAVSICQGKQKTFEYIIKGTVIGEKSGNLYFSDDYGKSGTFIKVKVKNGRFEIKGNSEIINSAFFLVDGEPSLYSLIIEPGKIILELNTDSLYQKSKTIKGKHSIAVRQAEEIRIQWMKNGVTQNKYQDSLKQLIINNKSNFASIWELYMRSLGPCILNLDELGELLNGVTEPFIRSSKEFKVMNSYLIASKDSINAIGKKAKDFKLPDQTGTLINFSKVSSGKYTFVEKSGSWCGSSTIITQSYRPVYEKFKEKGFEIITVVGESNHKRWKKWVRKEKFPWKTLVELVKANKDNKLYSELLFINGNYLVNDKGVVIATNLTSESLEEVLNKYL